MLIATKDKILPTTITGSLPRPSWYTRSIGAQSFVESMVSSEFREQYTDTVSCYLHEQEIVSKADTLDGIIHKVRHVVVLTCCSHRVSAIVAIGAYK